MRTYGKNNFKDFQFVKDDVLGKSLFENPQANTSTQLKSTLARDAQFS